MLLYFILVWKRSVLKIGSEPAEQDRVQEVYFSPCCFNYSVSLWKRRVLEIGSETAGKSDLPYIRASPPR
jgi:hypothetical protein